jgi:hypothetical protein
MSKAAALGLNSRFNLFPPRSTCWHPVAGARQRDHRQRNHRQRDRPRRFAM